MSVHVGNGKAASAAKRHARNQPRVIKTVKGPPGKIKVSSDMSTLLQQFSVCCHVAPAFPFSVLGGHEVEDRREAGPN